LVLRIERIHADVQSARRSGPCALGLMPTP
jgi:hypothetical protein